MRILFVVTSAPFAKDFNTVRNLIEEFIKSEDEVSVFLAGNGAYYLLRPEVRAFADRCRFLYCSHSAHERGIEQIPQWAESSSTYNLSKMLADFDKVIVFN